MITNATDGVRWITCRPQKYAHRIVVHHDGAVWFAKGLDRQRKERVIKACPGLATKLIQMLLRHVRAALAGKDHARGQIGECDNARLRKILARCSQVLD